MFYASLLALGAGLQGAIKFAIARDSVVITTCSTLQPDDELQAFPIGLHHILLFISNSQRLFTGACSVSTHSPWRPAKLGGARERGGASSLSAWATTHLADVAGAYLPKFCLLNKQPGYASYGR